METIQPLMLLLVVIGFLLIGGSIVWPAQKPIEYVTCMDVETREDLRNAMRAGIDRAMQSHTSRMFTIWMKDATGQPERAIHGMQNAVKAYVGSRKVANEWSPPVC
jgi:hypothetical protein